MPEISLPTPGVTPGPEYAQQINAAIEAVNSGKAELVNGRVADSELPTRLSPSSLQTQTQDEIKSSSTLDFLGLKIAPVSPMKYGASGDGTGDDTAAVQAAVAEVQARGFRGGSVMLKNHAITAPIRISQFNVTIEGEGGSLTGGGLHIARNTTPDDMFTRVNNLTIDLNNAADSNGIMLDMTGKVDIDNVRIQNATRGFFVPNRNLHQHVRRVKINMTDVRNCTYGWFSDQPADNANRYTVGDLTISNGLWENSQVTLFAHGLDGLNMSNFKSFQRSNSSRGRGFDLDYVNFVNLTNVNIFEPGQEGLRLSRSQNFTWAGGKIAWPGQLIPSDGILFEGGDLAGNVFTLATFDNIEIQKPTRHGITVSSPNDWFKIGTGFEVQGAGDPEFYFGDPAALAAIGTHYGINIQNSAANSSRVFGGIPDRSNNIVIGNRSEVATYDSLGSFQPTRVTTVSDTRTSLGMENRWEHITFAQTSARTITAMTNPGINRFTVNLYGTNGNTTIQHGTGSNSIIIRLKGAVNATIPQYGTLTLMWVGDQWVETSRSF